jgi:hypothetical protein
VVGRGHTGGGGSGDVKAGGGGGGMGCGRLIARRTSSLALVCASRISNMASRSRSMWWSEDSGYFGAGEGTEGVVVCDEAVLAGVNSRAAPGAINSLPCSPSVTGYLREGNTYRHALAGSMRSWTCPQTYAPTNITTPTVQMNLTLCRLLRAQLYPSLTAGATSYIKFPTSHSTAMTRRTLMYRSPAPDLGGLLTYGTRGDPPDSDPPTASPTTCPAGT